MGTITMMQLFIKEYDELIGSQTNEHKPQPFIIVFTAETVFNQVYLNKIRYEATTRTNTNLQS